MEHRRPRRRRFRVTARRVHGDERGQALVIVLALITFLFLVGSSMAAHASVALRATAAGEGEAGDLHAADAGAELGIWWQRNGQAGNPPSIAVNGLTVTTTIATAGGGGTCAARTPVGLTGFEHGVVSTSGGGLFSAITGNGAAADAAVARSGAWSLRITDPAGPASSVALPASGATVVARVYLRLAALPAADVTELLALTVAAGSDLRLGYRAAGQRLTIQLGAAAAASAAPIVAATWYRLDLRLVANADPRTAEWEIDGVSQAAIASPEAASSVTTLRLGSSVGSDQYIANFDDVMTSATSADYPIGPGSVLPLWPDGAGTHNTPAAFSHEDGSAVGAGTPQRLDDDPMSSPADYVRQQVVGASSYLELTIADTTAACIVGVAGVVAYSAASSAADNGKTSIFDGPTERILFSGDMSEVALAYRSAIVPRAGGWTTAAVNDLRARIGYSSDVSPNPYWEALLLEVATVTTSPATVTVTASAGGSTVVTSYEDAGTGLPALLTWSATR